MFGPNLFWCTALYLTLPEAPARRLIDCYKIDVLPELVVREGPIAEMVKTSKEPSTVLRVYEESLSWTLVVLLGYREYLRGAVTGSGLGWPHTNLPPVVEDETLRAAVLEDGVVVLVLVELDAPVEPGAVLGVAVVSLPRALQHCLGVLSDALDLTLPVHDPDDPEGGDVDAPRGGDGDDILGSGEEVLLEAGHNQLARFPLQTGHDLPQGPQQRLPALPADILQVVSVDTVQTHSSQPSQQGVLGLYLKTRVVVKTDPLAPEEGVGTGQILISFQGPVACGQNLTDLETKYYKSAGIRQLG